MGVWHGLLRCSALAVGILYSLSCPADILYLNLILNRWDTGVSVVAYLEEGKMQVETAQLQQLLPKLPMPDSKLVDLATLDLLDYQYHPLKQNLHLQLAPAYFAGTEIAVQQWTFRGAQTAGNAFWVNYDVYGEYANKSSDFIRVNSEWLMSWHGWQLSHQQFFNLQSGFTSTRLDTRARYDFHDTASAIELGDVVSQGFSWTRAYRMGGIKFGKDYSLRPDLVTYPVPSFNGSAEVPTSLSLLINGIAVQQSELLPGPYVVESLPFVNGSGQATLVVQDIMGRNVQLERPFYVSRKLLAPGMNDYSLALGVFRSGFGQDSADYGGKAVLTGYYRQGLSRYVTLGGYFESDTRHTNLGLEWQQQLGLLGVLTFGVRRSQEDSSTLVRYAYEYQSDRFSWSVSHQRSNQFRDILGWRFGNLPPVNTSQANLSLNLNPFGVLATAYVETEDTSGESNRLLNLSYSRQVNPDISVFFNLNQDLDQDDTSLSLNLNWRLGRSRSVAYTHSRSPNEVNYGRFRYSQGRVGNLGLGIAASQTIGLAKNVSQFRTMYALDTLEVSAGAFAQGERHSVFGGATGSVALVDGTPWFTRSISRAYALVEVSGLDDIPVYAANQLVGHTDDQGRLLVPNLIPHLDNKISIDVISLPPHIAVDHSEKVVRPNSQTGARVSFPVRFIHPLLLAVFMDDGSHLPMGSLVTTDNGLQTYSGWGGQVNYEQAPGQFEFRAKLPNGGLCKGQYIEPKDAPINRFGNVRCELIKKARKP